MNPDPAGTPASSDGPLSGLLSEGQTLPEPLPADPMPLARAWLDLAVADRVQPNPTAMTLATIDGDGSPSARTVLCRDLNVELGYAVFYTNYESRKGRALAANPRAALLFHWDAFDRQIRIEGPVMKSPPEESDAYFAHRPWESRLGAWASDQSRPLRSRDELLERVVGAADRLGLSWSDLLDDGNAVPIPRPPHWGGFRVWARSIELWLGGKGRLHDRAVWKRELTPRGDLFDAGPWSCTRLMP
ncbi:MAG: pyridoxamine 5'-phosphate oxidase [Phycisphaerales bacterium]|nr:pyridoxamine 5'-phosphate oxidase [Phycisphaerales bacterium]